MTSAGDPGPALRPRSRTVTVVAWTIVAGMTLAVVVPVIALLFG